MNRNGAVWRDTAGGEIWCNGGQLLRDGDTWLWTGLRAAPHTPWEVRLYASTNLVDWEFRGALFRRAGAFERFGWAGRPALLRRPGGWVVIFEGGSREWFRHRIGYAVAPDLAGPWSLGACDWVEPGRSTGDQSVWEDGGEAYLVTVLDTPGLAEPINASLAIYRLRPDRLGAAAKLYEGFRLDAPDARGNEASHLVRHAGAYYWFMSGLVSWNSSSTWYATASDLAGPWSVLRPVRTEPHSEDSYNTQHDCVVPLGPGAPVSHLYVGDRYSQFHGKGEGRNLFLPLTFEGGEPVLRWSDGWPPVAGGVPR